jgi:hypothetical protein
VLTAQRGPEPSVHVERELDALVTDEKQAFAVIAQSREREVRHLLSCSSPAVVRCAEPTPAAPLGVGSLHGAPW